MRGDNHKRCRDAPYLLARLLDSFTRTREQRWRGNNGGGTGARVRVPAARGVSKGGGYGSGGEVRGCSGALNSQEGSLSCGPRMGTRARVGLGGGGSSRPRVRLGHAPGKKMTGGGHLSSAVRGGGSVAGWRRFAGPAGPHGEVLDWAEAKQENGPRERRAATAACWAGSDRDRTRVGMRKEIG
jgi:hypothetical protein